MIAAVVSIAIIHTSKFFEGDLYSFPNMRKYCMDFLFAKNMHFLYMWLALSQQEGLKSTELAC